ncbi:MAG: tRNA 2-thiocytidine biosynthesis TtcA family protein [Acidaminococcaceae bacterium]
MPKTPFLPAEYLTKLWRSLIEFHMLAEGDKILIGLSGGKDSMFLTAALAEVQKHAPVHFELACYTVDSMFDNNFPAQKLEDFCHQFGLVHYHEQVNVMKVWKGRGNTPCFSCAYFRRAATNRKACELGFNKIALAHHNDDAVETFLLNLLNSGQQKTFLPVTFLTRTQLTVLRPLIYYRENEIIEYGQKINLKPLKNPCPYDGHTKRQEMKELIITLSKNNPELYCHLAAAMRETSGRELWPEALPQEAMINKFRTFWKK